MQKQEEKIDCTGLIVKLAELHNLKQDFDVAAEKLFTTKDADVSILLIDLEKEISQIISDVEAGFKSIFENRGLDRLEELQGIYPDDKHLREVIVSVMCGLDSDRAWDIREKFIKDFNADVVVSYLLPGIAGTDSERSWKIRENYLDTRSSTDSFQTPGIISLVGLESEKAWDMRERCLKTASAGSMKVSYLMKSLAGCDSDRAWEMREILIKAGSDPISNLGSLRGLDSDRAWQKREEYIASGIGPESIIENVIGLDSDRAWEIRSRFGDKVKDKVSLVWSITGLDSERAWKMREDLLKDGVSIDYILESICGIDSSRAWTMRNEFKVESTPDATSLARSFFGRSFTSPLTIGKNR